MTGSACFANTCWSSYRSLRISVTVSYGSYSITLDGYRTRYAPNILP